MLYRIIAILTVALLVMFVYSIFVEHQPEWVHYQDGFNRYVRIQEAALGRELNANMRPGVRQVLTKSLDLVDRCQTCHLGAEDPLFVDAPQPYTTHPKVPSHPFDRFGCVPCHQGQPWGTNVQAAHGNVAFWHEPLLRRQYVEASCGRCHAETEVRDAPVLSRGRRLMLDLGCEECHRINGLGGITGPDLTDIARRQPIAYLRESLVDPKANDSNSVMPDFGLDADDVHALIVALMAITSPSPYAELRPEQAVEERVYHASYRTDSLEEGARLLRSFGCVHCHRTGDVGVPYGGDLSGIGLAKSADDIFTYLASPEFDSLHPTLHEIEFRSRQIELVSNYLATLKDENVVAVVPAVSRPSATATTPARTAVATDTDAPITRTAAFVPPGTANSQISVSENSGDVETGKKLYAKKNCKMCHKLGGSGGRIGPALDDVGTRRNAEWLFFHFKDPQAISPGTRMPNNNFTDEEAQALTAYMLTLKK